jgi:MFS transporter, putative metabolite:H+ symporter
MSLATSNLSLYASKKAKQAAAIMARQDRIPVWALPRLFIGIIGLGFFFTFFDIGDINVSFFETCSQIVTGCNPETASQPLALSVIINLAGYMIGALVFGLLADRYGRRDMLVFTMVITGLGSLYTVFVGDFTNFVLARAITGVGVGADLVLVNTYINEMAPRRDRVKYTALIFILATLGITTSIWLGLYLTTPPAVFPFGLPFALAGPHFTTGWRVLYGIGTSLALVGLFLRFDLPESPRWLLSQGRLSEAERVVGMMEQKAYSRMPELPPIESELPVRVTKHGTGYTEIFSNAVYLKRTILLLVIWLAGYTTVYSIIAGLTVILGALHYPIPEAGLLSAIGICGSVVCGFVIYFFGELLERKAWLMIAALVGIVGGVLIVLSNGNPIVAFLGVFILSTGSYLWLPVTYTWSTENYPTRARAFGFALVDGIGHTGGGIGFYVIAPLAPKLGPLTTFLLIGCFLLVAAGLALFGPATRQKRLDEVSP